MINDNFCIFEEIYIELFEIINIDIDIENNK